MTGKEKSVLTFFCTFTVILIACCVAVSFVFKANTPQEIEEERSPAVSTLADNISIDEAKNIALSHCNQQANSDIIFTSQKLDYDDGKEIYELEFTDGKIKYEYDISANSGAVLKYSSELAKID